ncbi:hypothetical protein BDR26DRAFT_851770 [Obelidium mucronatum]|nr:hypothetical protein BDR26DRAFT_851770 [Obelidium mucronatum]
MKGVCVVAFKQPTTHLIGHFVSLETQEQQQSIIGFTAALANDPPESHPCCHNHNEKPVFWDLKLVQFANGDEAEEERHFDIVNVQQLEGGDALVLDTQHSDWIVKDHAHSKNTDTIISKHALSFRTRILKSSEAATRSVQKYFPHLINTTAAAEERNQDEWIVCIGEMHLTLDNEE